MWQLVSVGMIISVKRNVEGSSGVLFNILLKEPGKGILHIGMIAGSLA
jgi:hypothetical protein